MWFEMRNPNVPWLTEDMIKILASCLRKTDIVLELGSGRSTTWFSPRVGSLISVENNEGYYRKVASQLAKLSCKNVNLVHISTKKDYIGVITQLPDMGLDLALIDGKYRDESTMAVLPKLKSGGLLVIDNCDRYLTPANEHVRNTIGLGRPAKVSILWKQIKSELMSWRCIWTTNGVCDTVLYIKP
jgi:predicted O-methyltransferase YrrM